VQPREHIRRPLRSLARELVGQRRQRAVIDRIERAIVIVDALSRDVLDREAR
jgi:hypothetical protein